MLKGESLTWWPKSITWWPEERQLFSRDSAIGQYSIEHVRGCAHGCRFPCFAFKMSKEKGNVTSLNEWRQPRLRSYKLQQLDIELPLLNLKIERVHLCKTTDPFMVGHPEVTQLSLAIIRKLHENGIIAETLTKGITPEALVDTQTYGKDNVYGISLSSLDRKFKRRFEPYSAEYDERIAALETLHEAGLKTFAAIAPYPSPDIFEQRLDDILEAISFVDHIVFGPWNHYVAYEPMCLHRNFFTGQRVMLGSGLDPSQVEFYTDCGTEVSTFCDNHNIDATIALWPWAAKTKHASFPRQD